MKNITDYRDTAESARIAAARAARERIDDAAEREALAVAKLETYTDARDGWSRYELSTRFAAQTRCEKYWRGERAKLHRRFDALNRVLNDPTCQRIVAENSVSNERVQYRRCRVRRECGGLNFTIHNVNEVDPRIIAEFWERERIAAPHNRPDRAARRLRRIRRDVVRVRAMLLQRCADEDRPRLRMILEQLAIAA